MASETKPGPSQYEIIVEGHLDDHWRTWFDGFQMEALPGDYVCISGEFLDPPALHGVLERIRDLNLTLVQVKRRPVGWSSPG